MTKAKTFVLLLAAAAMCAAAPLAQAASTTTLLEVPYGLGPSTNTGGVGRDNSIIAAVWAVDDFGMLLYDETHCNQGGSTGPRVVKAHQHTYIADWDTAQMITDVDVGGQLTGWGSYTPNYCMAIMPRVGTTVNDNGTPTNPNDDFIDPVSPSAWPDPGSACTINISSVWSENDWYEGPGTGFDAYNWNAVSEYASTVWYAGDTLITPMAIPWSFPGGGDDGTGNPWPAFADCTFIETFHTLGDHHDFDPSPAGAHGPGWQPWNGVPKTPTNSTSYVIDNSVFVLTDVNNTPTNPLDDLWMSPYVEVQLDQAMMDDMFNNVDNRGVALWEWGSWNNGQIYGADQNASQWPYINARIEVLSGDANLDKAVDGLDYVAWSNNYNQAATWQTGDFNNDLLADGLDYVVWSNNYGATLPGAPGVVPEPATMALLAMGAVALIRRRR